jgi:hypothetical protein
MEFTPDTSSSQGGSDMYGIMKGGPSGPGGNIGPTSLPGQFPLGEGPGPMPMGPGDMPPVMNGRLWFLHIVMKTIEW